MKTDCYLKTPEGSFRYRVGALIIEDGELLMVRNPLMDYYYTVGGGVHLGETSAETAEREAFEETSLHYKVDRLAFIHETFFIADFDVIGKPMHGIEFYYLMKPMGKKDIHCHSLSIQGEKEYAEWVPIAKLKEIKTAAIFPEFLKNCLSPVPEGITHIITNELKQTSA